MSKEQMNVPKLRFPEFTGEWEKRKFANIAQRQSETIVSDDENPCVEYEDVVAERGVLNKDIYAKGVYKNGIKFTSEDVLYGKLRPYLHNWLNPYFSGVAVGDWWVLRPVNTDKDFLYWMIQTPKYDNVANQSAGTKMPRADWKLVSNLEFHVPISRTEQKTIADILTNFDTLITLQHRKLDQIKEYKKGMLQKMFPKEGESVPEVRFPGFTGEWERRKLGDVLEDLYNGQTPSRVQTSYWNGDINWLTSGELNRGIVYTCIERITKKGQESAHLKIIPRGTFVMAITGLEASGTRGNCAILGIDTTLNQSCMALMPDPSLLSTRFLFQWYKMVGEEYGTRFTQGTKQQSYNAEIIKSLDIVLPSVKEQEQISDVLVNLDNLISLHQRKLDAMKEYKKGLLQQMFV